LTGSTEQISFRGRTVNFIQNGIENKRLGDLGELWVMKHEIDKLKEANKHNLIEKVKHTSKDEGDGTGFDIQSFDKEGNKIFIEVKTTKGKKNSTFFITRNELEKSKIEKASYFLYRLYNYNEQFDTADLLVIKGDLTNLCEFPTTYKINLTND
jgi:RecB family endonuclease NucS